MASVDERIKELQDKIKALKVAKQDASKEVEEMKALKAQQSKDKKDGPAGFQLKVPKGTIDHKPAAALLRKKIFATLEGIFAKHGGEVIDTPVFELKEILAGKYGEDSKLIYDLQDQGGELCSLRYDLTVSRKVSGRSVLTVIGPLCALPRHERRHVDEALPHCQGLPPRPARHVQGPHARVLPVRL